MLDDLYIFEIANNHQGSVEHGKAIIHAMGGIARKYNLHAAVKFQFRDLDTLIHPLYKNCRDVPHIPRFLDTRLDDEQFRELIAAARRWNLTVIATPFDEASVRACVDRGVDVIKIASSSAHDWPLLEAIAGAGKPVICSTGGLDLAEIDRVERFFSHRGVTFALLHCVSTYPAVNVNLGMLARMVKRYPTVTIGYSGHEAPGNTAVVQLAVALGARILERHVGIPTETTPLNSYSMNPEQAEAWVRAALEARRLCQDGPRDEAERASLQTLQRGVYARRAIRRGETITRDAVYFAMPLQPGQLDAGRFGEYRAAFTASCNYSVDTPIFEPCQPDALEGTRAIVRRVRGMLAEAGIVTGVNEVELSHHYGLDKFREYGAAIINVLNQPEYCKKIVVVLPGQRHPSHYHVRKQETFHVLNGILSLTLNGIAHTISAGEQITIRRGDWHDFSSAGGAVIEEVSTHHFSGDSVYFDDRIKQLDPMQRKTVVEF